MALPAVLLLALAAVLVVLVLRKLLGGGAGGRGSTVLLVGPCDSGKTTMWHQLLQGSTHLGTVASMQPNVGEGPLASEQAAAAASGAPPPRPVQLVDIPGHPRLRGQLERHGERAAGVVFVLDSVDFMPHKTETAEQLMQVLSSPALAKRRAPVLLACNKQDAGSRAHTVDFIRKRLEKELDQLRSTRGALSDVSGGGGGGAPLGVPGEPFTFEAHARAHGVRVTPAGVSAVDRGGVAEVEAFIRRCVPA